MEQPLVSVIMPSYNAEQFIAESIESVLHQTYQNWELVVTDDCSSDRTPEIVQSYCDKDSRIHFAIAKRHSGIAGTRNQCIARAKGRFIAFLDNDDLWHPEKLEKQIRFMLEKGCACSYSAYELLRENGTPKGKTIKTAGVINYDRYLRNTIIGSGTIMLDREQTGSLVMPDNATSDDMALWCKILKDGHFAYPIPEVLMLYRVRSNSASANKFKAAKDVWLVYRKQEKLSFFRALGCFFGYAFNAIKKRLQ
ncbi:MAG: glycosyltransferase [Bacteroidales bacterium]|nr:glycosyltransferase [Bacteroidales bacterium]